MPILLAIYLCLLLVGCSQPQPPTINLYRAVHIEDIDQVERNLFWNAKVDQPGPDGQTPLHVAAQQGSLVVIRMLLKHGADTESMDRQGHTPLATALLARNTLVADYFVKQQAQVDADALLHETVRLGQADRDVIDFLLKQGADLNKPDKAGIPPLHLAIRSGYRVIVKNLILKGADIDMADKTGSNPLQIAIEKGEKDIEQMLRKFGASANP